MTGFAQPQRVSCCEPARMCVEALRLKHLAYRAPKSLSQFGESDSYSIHVLEFASHLGISSGEAERLLVSHQ